MGLVECLAGDTEEALKVADRNLYRAKRDGRDCLVVSVQAAEAAP